MSRKLVFVDTETTGLCVETEDIVELTYATLDLEPRTLWFGVKEVPEFIDNLIGFSKRGISGRTSLNSEVLDFLQLSDDATMVAANPGFDKGFIDKAGLWVFHYHMLDIESYAMAKLGLDFVPSMKQIYEILTDMGYKITTPDHTSYNDVMALRDSFRALESM